MLDGFSLWDDEKNRFCRMENKQRHPLENKIDDFDGAEQGKTVLLQLGKHFENPTRICSGIPFSVFVCMCVGLLHHFIHLMHTLRCFFENVLFVNLLWKLVIHISVGNSWLKRGFKRFSKQYIGLVFDKV